MELPAEAGGWLTCHAVVVVEFLSRVRLFETPSTVACQAPLSSIVSQS